jgi:hypothetical protein
MIDIPPFFSSLGCFHPIYIYIKKNNQTDIEILNRRTYGRRTTNQSNQSRGGAFVSLPSSPPSKCINHHYPFLIITSTLERETRRARAKRVDSFDIFSVIGFGFRLCFFINARNGRQRVIGIGVGIGIPLPHHPPLDAIYIFLFVRPGFTPVSSSPPAFHAKSSVL